MVPTHLAELLDRERRGEIAVTMDIAREALNSVVDRHMPTFSRRDERSNLDILAHLRAQGGPEVMEEMINLAKVPVNEVAPVAGPSATPKIFHIDVLNARHDMSNDELKTLLQKEKQGEIKISMSVPDEDIRKVWDKHMFPGVQHSPA